MKTKIYSALIIELPHMKKEINGFGYSKINDIFWWFHNHNKILYHYRSGDSSRVSKTQYLELPENVTKEKYKILEYLEKSNSLVLSEL